MSFPRYQKYKDSGEDWLGGVPDHWTVISIKWLSPVKRGASPRPIDDPIYFDDQGEFAWVRIADVSACDGTLMETTQRLSERGSSLSVKIEPGDLFVSIAGTVGKPCLSGIKACIHDGFVYFPTLEIDPKFLYRIFEGGVCYGGLGKWGTQLNLNTDTIGSIRIALPCVEEVEQILKFLDRETAKIDELVTEQRRLIDLLTEKRQAVISHAVTKGLDPNAPMKDSGIEWLGDVPQHWSLAAVGFRYSVQLGKMLDTEKITGEHLQPYLRVFDVQWGEINVDDLPQMDFPPSIRDRFRLAPGDLLINEGGSYPGRSAIWQGELEECYFQKALHRLRPRDPKTDTTRFFYYIMAWATTRGVFTAGGNESTIEHLPADKFRKYRFAFPPLSEQLEIANFLDQELGRFDTLIAESKRGIELLQERRTALISAAVTGKIDVRGLVEAEAA